MNRILLAEDEEVLRMLIVDTLEDEDYMIDEAADGSEAMDLLQKNQYSFQLHSMKKNWAILLEQRIT